MKIVLKTSFLFMLVMCGSVQAELSVECNIPNGLSCDITDHQNLIKHVTVISDEPFYLVLVDKDFPCVSTATVEWDSSYHSKYVNVTYCGIQVPEGMQDFQFEGNNVYDRNLKGVINKSTARLPIPQRNGLTYTAKLETKLFKVNIDGIRKTSLLQSKTTYSGQLTTNSSGMGAKYYCCNEGTTEGCFEVNALAQCGTGLDFLACDDEGGCTSYPN